jgi:hypothetical protein
MVPRRLAMSVHDELLAFCRDMLRDKQDENAASIRMRTQFWDYVGRA